MSNKYKIIEEACCEISNGNLENAKNVINVKYRFEFFKNKGRNYTNSQKTKIFLRDGFIDRYSGEKLIYPPVLRILSFLMPTEFPFHKNWKTSECHIAYWQLYPTIDHIIPVSRGGKDHESNWVSTSQLRNSSKSNWLLEELGWELNKPGNINEWDGMFFWFLNYSEQHPDILDDNYILSWHKAARREQEKYT
ncbi:HNH endonuclease [Desulfococcaceae bacterium HSG8]|nr:HNH endonuclease [Desulfococcaceae bacterium HSG8]